MSRESILNNMGNKWKLTKIILFIMLSGTWLCGCGGRNGANTVYTADAYALNTYVSVSLYGCGSQEIAEEAVGLCDYYEKIFSRTDEASLLSILNEAGSMTAEDVLRYEQNAGTSGGLTNTEQTDVEDESARIYADLYELVAAGLEYGRLTEGALDITIEPLSSLWDFGSGPEHAPDAELISQACARVDYTKVKLSEDAIELNGARIDLGAVAKGYIADAICEYLLKQGIDSALVNLGGNIACIGDKPDGSGFTIGIQRPFDESGDIMQTLSVSDMSVVTSGIYERYFYEGDNFYHHILDPKTGYPCDNGLMSVTIISESSTICDCLSTGCFVLGKDKALELIDSMDDVYAVFVDENYEITYSEGAEKFLK